MVKKNEGTPDREPAVAEPRFDSVRPELGSDSGWDGVDLAVLLTLQAHEDGGLVSRHVDANTRGAVFGGQLIGQAISAAGDGQPAPLSCHSVQLQFLVPGQPGLPMRYEVQRLLAGMSFVVLQVLGLQGERALISAHVSFQRREAGAALPAADARGLPAAPRTCRCCTR